METYAVAGEGQIFILDIGTRSVVGIAGHKEGDIFVVDAHSTEPHARRAMIDGQIEDIEQVARIAGTVKQRIEEKLEVRFTRVSVAAAGRALKTCRATAKTELAQTVPITPQVVYGLENAAINEARIALDIAGEQTPYYCVGHSAVRYLLDGYPFQTIVGHRAALAEVEIIATFLPAEVVESLRQCMELLGLEVDTLTLEPIAAMRAVIPQDLRLLNLALADIGAGTADIAISAEGTVAGYTMATVAGDEVTETIIKQFLVDFATAERLKLALDGAEEPYHYTDILGFDQTTDRAAILETIAPAVNTLAQVISDRIVECNTTAPAAVFLVGGGSKTPGLCEKVAEKLGLPQNRVALAGTNFSGKLLNENSGVDGPEYATPVGIALIAADNAEVEGSSVYINDRRVRLFTPAETGVMDALLMGGYTYSDLMGRNGRSLTFILNGVRTVVRGGPYTAAELTVNGKAASLSTQVENGDHIQIAVAQSGEDATACVADYAKGERPMRVSLNGRTLLAGLIARVNGTVATPDTGIFDGDELELYFVHTVQQLCAAAGIQTEGATILVNGAAAPADHVLHDEDNVVCTPPGTAAQAPVQPTAEAAPPLPSPPSAELLQPRAEADTAPAAATPAPAPETSAAAAESAPAPSVPAVESPVRQPAPATSAQAPLQPTAETPPPLPTPPSAELLQPRAEADTAPAAATPAPMPETSTAATEPATAVSVPAVEIPARQPAHAAPVAEPAPVPPSPSSTAAPTPEPPFPVARPSLTPEIVESTEPAASAPAPAADSPAPAEASEPAAESATPVAKPAAAPPPKPVAAPEPTPTADTATPPTAPTARSLRIQLNGKTVVLPPKPTGEPHRLFDMLALVDIDPANPKGLVRVTINGKEAAYLEELVNGDTVDIGWEER